MTTPARASAAGTSGGAAATSHSSSFFHQERERLITEIADSMESLLGNVNTLNRKLEESIAVGQEFEPIANLWGPFVDILTASGLSASQRQGQAAQSNTTAGSGAPRTHATPPSSSQYSDELVLSSEGAVENTLPPGIAPGGGHVYGQDTN